MLALSRFVGDMPPAAGGAVMATGIVSVGLSLDGVEWLSRAMLAVAAVLWAALGAVSVRRALWARGRRRGDAAGPAALTGVAGTAVLGTRLALLGWRWAAWALLALAAGLWAVLLRPALRGADGPAAGSSFLLTVATASLAVLAASLANATGARWPAIAALALVVAGLVLYVLVAARFDLGQLRTGAGDQWVAGGALAISALACANLAEAAQVTGALAGVRGVLQAGALALWVAAMAWLPVLTVAEARWPRPGYDVRRWATAFPVAMYAVMSFSVGAVAHARGIADFARVEVWVGLAVWALVAAGAGRRAAALARGR
jgi:tellurite resistance protein TehA-like permease